MRRILWLLLALSLPAWATINAITSTRILLPSYDGVRYAEYPDGDLPIGPSGLLYENVFDGNPTNTADDVRQETDATSYGNIGIFANQSDAPLNPDSISWIGENCGSGRQWDGPDITTVVDPDDAENTVVKTVMDASASGFNLECASTLRHRAFFDLAMHLNVDRLAAGETPETTGKTDGDGFRIRQGGEYWFGWRFRINCTAKPPSTNIFFFSPMSSTVGEPVVYLHSQYTKDGVTKNCSYLEVVPERYNAAITGKDSREVHTTPVGPYEQDEWHCAVLHWIKKPYPLPGGGTREGTFEMWVDGGAPVASSANATNGYAYTGTDRVARGELNPRVRTGLYWTTETNSAVVTTWQDDWRIAEGANKSSFVNPPGCPAITP